jgi:hypothetical protein
LKSSWYAVLAIVFPVLLPLAFQEKITDLAIGILMIVAFNLILFTAYATSSRQLSYFRGLDIIAASFMSGCANLTLLYIVPVLFLIQLWALMYSFVATIAGRRFSQHRWILLVNSFYERRTGQRLPAMEVIDSEPF